MKKSFMMLILLIITFYHSSAQKNKDVLYLKNGSIIKGTLIDITGDQYKIQTSDGGLFIFSAPEVARYLRHVADTGGIKKSGFGLSLESGFLIGSQSSRYEHPFSFNCIANYNFDKKNSFGLGSGVEFFGSTFSPLYIEYRHLLYEKSITPFLFFRCGGLFHLGSDVRANQNPPQYNVPGNYKGGSSVTIGTGISWVKENLTTYLSFAYRYVQTSFVETTYNTGDIKYKDYYNRLEIKLGFKF